jgi:hypothetical protein
MGQTRQILGLGYIKIQLYLIISLLIKPIRVVVTYLHPLPRACEKAGNDPAGCDYYQKRSYLKMRILSYIGYQENNKLFLLVILLIIITFEGGCMNNTLYQWEVIATFDNEITSIEFVSPTKGWISELQVEKTVKTEMWAEYQQGTNRIQLTEDGGKTWQVIYESAGSLIEQLQYIESKDWLLGVKSIYQPGQRSLVQILGYIKVWIKVLIGNNFVNCQWLMRYADFISLMKTGAISGHSKKYFLLQPVVNNGN